MIVQVPGDLVKGLKGGRVLKLHLAVERTNLPKARLGRVPWPKRWAIKPDDSLSFFNCWGPAGVGDSVCPQIIVTQFTESIMGLEL